MKLRRMVWKDLRGAEPLRQAAEAGLTRGCVRDDLYAEEVLGEWGPGVWTSIRVPDLVDRPEAEIRRVYEHFDWTDSPASAQAQAQAPREARGWKSRHSDGLEELGRNGAALRKQLDPVYARFRLDAPLPAVGMRSAGGVG